MAFEEKIEDQASATKRRRKDWDCVQVNVGGTIFTTSKLTLISNSSYFASRFSPDWDDRDEDTDTDKNVMTSSIFVDQNSKSFDVLLAFMREGFIKKSELTESVLSQAEYFGIENLLRAVKCAAFRYINPVTCTISDDEACKRFDNTYGGIVGAIKEGVLPLKIKKISQEHHGAKEYARLIIFDGTIDQRNIQNFGGNTTLCVEVRVPARVSLQPDPASEAVAVANCHTCLDAFNWLHKHGFVTEEKRLERFPLDLRPIPWNICWFSRLVETGVDSGTNYIIFDDEVPSEEEAQARERRQFAALVIYRTTGVNLMLADVGREVEMSISTARHNNAPPHLLGQEVLSKITVKDVDEGTTAITWLSQNGYTREEESLGKLYKKVTCRTIDHWLGEDWLDPDDANAVQVMLLSRKLET
jgi:hypothetical protein